MHFIIKTRSKFVSWISTLSFGLLLLTLYIVCRILCWMILIFYIVMIKNLWSNIWLKKIFATLGSMPRCRSPALDGLKVDFYLFYWNKVHGCLFKAISHFFLTYRMPKYCGNTYVALIPWLDSNIFVFDFWPIPLCKVCYKSSIKSWSIALKMWLYISCSWAK